jgi:hypothetical protein
MLCQEVFTCLKMFLQKVTDIQRITWILELFWFVCGELTYIL